MANDSGSTLQNLEYLAGASADRDGEKLFESKKVGLQAWNPEDRTWEDLDELGYAVGYIGYTDELAPDYEVAVPMRINVRADAPVAPDSRSARRSTATRTASAPASATSPTGSGSWPPARTRTAPGRRRAARRP